MSGHGAVVGTPGSDSIVGTLGPFTRSLRDLQLFCEAYSSASPWVEDGSLVPTHILNPGFGPQLETTKYRPLRVGILYSDGIVNPLPPVRLVLKKTSQLLQNSPMIRVKTFRALDHEVGWRVVAANYFEDGGKNLRDICDQGQEPLLPLTEWILKQAETALEATAPTAEGRRAARDAFRHQYTEHWNEAEVDVVLAPVSPSTAPVLGTSMYWGYTAIWNLLQYPSVAFPASSFIDGWKTANLESEKYVPRTETEKSIYKNYSSEVSQGLPVGLQVVARRLHEHNLLKAMHIIEHALKGN